MDRNLLSNLVHQQAKAKTHGNLIEANFEAFCIPLVFTLRFAMYLTERVEVLLFGNCFKPPWWNHSKA
jgi:hypothetical protein